MLRLDKLNELLCSNTFWQIIITRKIFKFDFHSELLKFFTKIMLIMQKKSGISYHLSLGNTYKKTLKIYKNAKIGFFFKNYFYNNFINFMAKLN